MKHTRLPSYMEARGVTTGYVTTTYGPIEVLLPTNPDESSDYLTWLGQTQTWARSQARSSLYIQGIWWVGVAGFCSGMLVAVGILNRVLGYDTTGTVGTLLTWIPCGIIAVILLLVLRSTRHNRRMEALWLRSIKQAPERGWH